MKYFVKKLACTLAAFVAGMAFISVIEAAMTIANQRHAGQFGGEVLLLPLLLLACIISFNLGRCFFEHIAAKQIFKEGYKKALKQIALKDKLQSEEKTHE